MKALHLFVWVIGFGLASCTPGSKINKIVQKELLTDSSLQHAHIGICVYDPSHSQFLYQYQSEKYFIPASNTKLFSLYAALRYLGDSITGLEYVQTDSALWIRPTGDPSFLSPHFTAQPVYEFLKNSPSKQIRIDWPTVLPDRYGNGWMIADITEDETLPRSVFPVDGHVPVYSDSRHQGIPLFPDNGRESIQFLSDTLEKNIVLATAPQGMPWKKIYSVPTDSLLRYIMLRSDNHMAEQVLLMASQAKWGKMREDALIENLLNTELRDIPQIPRWVDGSGASRYNLFTPASMVYLLEKMQSEFGTNRLRKLLPTGGEGTLAKYYLDIPGSIYAKTGTLSNNQALSGFLLTKKGRWLTFSIMVNHYKGPARPVRQKVEAFLLKLRNEN